MNSQYEAQGKTHFDVYYRYHIIKLKEKIGIHGTESNDWERKNVSTLNLILKIENWNINVKKCNAIEI